MKSGGRQGHESLERIVSAYQQLGSALFSQGYYTAVLLGIGKVTNIIEQDGAGGRTRMVGIVALQEEAARAQAAAATAAKPKKFTLEMSGNSNIVWFIPFSPTPMTLGRISGNDVVIAEQSISAQHCVFKWSNPSSVSIIDSKSSNGVWINDVRLERGKAQVLQGGEKLLLGRFQFLFMYPEGLIQMVAEMSTAPSPETPTGIFKKIS